MTPKALALFAKDMIEDKKGEDMLWNGQLFHFTTFRCVPRSNMWFERRGPFQPVPFKILTLKFAKMVI